MSLRLLSSAGVLATLFVCLVVASAASQEPDRAAPSDYKVADVVPGAISPDGRLLSYTDWSTGDLAIQDLTTGETRRLTNKGSWLTSAEFAEAVQAISRDGKQVAYAWHIENGCDLRIIGLDSAEPRVIYRSEEISCIEPQDWSPDDQHILATFLKKDGTGQTVLVSTVDGSVRVLPTVDSSSLNMTFSPDGRWIVYDSPPNEESAERDVYVLSTDGSRGVPLVEHPADDFALGWAPDGKRILFASDRAGTFGAWAVPVDDGEPSGAPEVVNPDMAPIVYSWVGLTPDGSYYYGQSAWESDVYLSVLDTATGGFQPPQTLVSHVGLDTSADWSPDGQFLAYARGRGQGPDPFVIGIHSVGTGEERRLPLGMKINRLGGHAFHPHWSPDGRSLLAQGRSRFGDSLFRIDADTGEVTPILQADGGVEWPVWSSDGKAILYRRSDTSSYGEQSLVVKDLETGREGELYRGDLGSTGEDDLSTGSTQPSVTAFPSHGGYVGASSLAVSPDGQRLAFVWSEWHEEGPSTALQVISTVTGGEARELLRVQPTERIFQPAWMPDGRHVLFGKGRIERQEPRFELWRIAVEGGEPEYLGLALEGRILYGLSVHPDGQRIAFTAGRDMGAQTWVMKNLLP